MSERLIIRLATIGNLCEILGKDSQERTVNTPVHMQSKSAD